MRTPLVSFIAVIIMFSSATAASAQMGTANKFTANLSLGSRGAMVVGLQKVLNADSDTRVADSGPGSIGNETDYFGPLTKAAVIRFQEKYASEVLTPVGLTKGNGYVGPYTRAKLNVLSTLVAAQENVNTPISSSTTTSQNPNMKNLDIFLAGIDRVATKKGFSATAILEMKEQVKKDVATTTNLETTFMKLVKSNSDQSATDNSFTSKIAATIDKVLSTLFLPERARAAGLPFGGPLIYPFFCNCSSTWLITIGPLPPNYVTELDYIPGSQAYLSYNIPGTSWLLGEYSGGSACWIIVPKTCLHIPSEGIITPIVGSSPS